MMCYYYSDPAFFIFTSELPKLLYYSHLTVLAVSLITGLYVYFKGRDLLLNQLVFLFTLVFSGWIFINLIAWGSNQSNLTMFVWPMFGVLQACIAALSVHIIYVFLYKRDLPLWAKVVMGLLFLPVVMLAPTDLTVSGFNLAWCDAFEYENQMMTFYYSSLGALAMGAVAGMMYHSYRTARLRLVRQAVPLTLGMLTFLFLFFFLTYLGSYLASVGMIDDSGLEFYAVFGMGFFVFAVAWLSVRFGSFNFVVHTPSILTVLLIVLISSQYTYSNSTSTTLALTSVTLVLTATTGLFLIRGVRKEIQQREQLQTLTKQLEKANLRLKVLDKQKSEFLSIASHQLRTPLTAIRGYASLLIEETFGKVPSQMKEPLDRIYDSSRLMAASIEDYLNVSRIEAGNMNYSYSDFNLRDEVDNLCDDMRPEAIRKGLSLYFKTALTSRAVVHADLGKTVQIVQNLITNAIKYTPEGSIRVLVRDNVTKGKIYVEVIDTGIGMSEETLEIVFEKFERAKNANAVNIHGTGLGMFVAIKMANAMGGDVTAYSEGEEKGSRFTFELPLAL
jgi:signal transduction histidine kinase